MNIYRSVLRFTQSASISFSYFDLRGINLINVYRKEGAFKKNGESYSVKSINEDDINSHLKKGWYPFLDDALNAKDTDKKESSSLSKLAKKSKESSKESLKESSEVKEENA